MNFKGMVKPRDEPRQVVKGRFEVKKYIEDEHLAFGWASVAIRVNGEQITDWHDDMIDPEDLEQAAYNYVEESRDGGEMHLRGGVAHLVESVMLTPEKLIMMGVAPDTFPTGWWIGFRVTDQNVWEKVKDGTYKMFSIEGEALRLEVHG